MLKMINLGRSVLGRRESAAGLLVPAATVDLVKEEREEEEEGEEGKSLAVNILA